MKRKARTPRIAQSGQRERGIALNLSMTCWTDNRVQPDRVFHAGGAPFRQVHVPTIIFSFIEYVKFI
jgi:hypothetical protein